MTVTSPPNASRTPEFGDRVNLIGVPVDAVDHELATSRVIQAALDGRSFAATALAVHGVIEACWHEDLRGVLWDFDLVVPDGQPVRWALNRLWNLGLADRVMGPDLMVDILEAASERGVPVGLYGSTPETLDLLTERLRARYPSLDLAAAMPSKFRAYDSSDEIDADIQALDAAGCRIVFVGLGCPRQERWAHEVARRSNLVTVAVGAAFDYHAGLLERANPLVARMGLEWAFRLAQEPRRLWRRYATTNPAFVRRVTAQLLGAEPPEPPNQPLARTLPPA